MAEPSAYESISAVMGDDLDYDGMTAYLDANMASCFTGVTGGDSIL